MWKSSQQIGGSGTAHNCAPFVEHDLQLGGSGYGVRLEVFPPQQARFDAASRFAPATLWSTVESRAFRLRRKSRITGLESIGARNGLSSLWVGRRPMGTQNPRGGAR